MVKYARKFQDSWNLAAYLTRVFSPGCVHDQKHPGNEVELKFLIHETLIHVIFYIEVETRKRSDSAELRPSQEKIPLVD